MCTGSEGGVAAPNTKIAPAMSVNGRFPRLPLELLIGGEGLSPACCSVVGSGVPIQMYIKLISVSCCRRLLLCRVTLGKPVEQITSVRIAHAPPGHHSVIGRPSAGGLNYPEYVIYRGEQVGVRGDGMVYSDVCMLCHRRILNSSSLTPSLSLKKQRQPPRNHETPVSCT